MLPVEESLETLEHITSKASNYGSPSREQIGSSNYQQNNSQIKEDQDMDDSDEENKNAQRTHRDNRNYDG